MHSREPKGRNVFKEGRRDLYDNYTLDSVEEYLSASSWPQICILAYEYKMLYSITGADAVFWPASFLGKETDCSYFLR